MNKESRIYIAGHTGLVGSAIYQNLQKRGYQHFILCRHSELDLKDQQAVIRFFEQEKPEYVFLAAAHVGGIMANNTYRADFIYDNLMMQNNIIHASYIQKVKKLLFLGSTCIYPKEAPQPMSEDCLLTSPLEYTNEPYAIAKIAGIKTCESFNIQYGTNYLSVMPTNLYGPNDNFNLETSHVLPAMIRKIYLAKCLTENAWNEIRADLNSRPIEEIDGNAGKEDMLAILQKYGIQEGELALWGTGKPMREFLWSEDMADACVYIMENIDFPELVKDKKEIRNTHINIGTGTEISIAQVAGMIKERLGFNGMIRFDHTKPDGTMRKLTDVTKLHGLGWRHSIDLAKGIEMLSRWYMESIHIIG